MSLIPIAATFMIIMRALSNIAYVHDVFNILFVVNQIMGFLLVQKYPIRSCRDTIIRFIAMKDKFGT